jgi:hypothetical protein
MSKMGALVCAQPTKVASAINVNVSFIASSFSYKNGALVHRICGAAIAQRLLVS